MANSVDQDEMAPHEPPHQDLRRLQDNLYSSLVLKDSLGHYTKGSPALSS